MGTERAQEPWILKAEALTRQVDLLLNSRRRIEKALAKKHGADFAAELLDQLECLTRALHAEAFRVVREGSRHRAGLLARVILVSLGVIGSAVVQTEVGDLWHNITGANSVAEQLLEACEEALSQDSVPVRHERTATDTLGLSDEADSVVGGIFEPAEDRADSSEGGVADDLAPAADGQRGARRSSGGLGSRPLGTTQLGS